MRTLLYYPTIRIPPGAWIRQAILYWDRVASIVPNDLSEHDEERRSLEMEMLERNKLYLPLYAKQYVKEKHAWSIGPDLERDFRARARAGSFQRVIGPRANRTCTVKIYRDKVSETLFNQYLEPRKLAEHSKDSSIYLFEPHTATLYMALLAKHIARVEPASTTAATSHPRYEQIAFNVADPARESRCLSIRLKDVFPMPRSDVVLERLLEFREANRASLLRLRPRLDDFATALANAADQAAMDSAIRRFAEEVEGDLHALRDGFRRFGIASSLSMLKTLVMVQAPIWITAGAVAAGRAIKITELPIQWTLGGALVGGVVSVASHIADAAKRRADEVEKSPFAYLYRAQNAGILRR